MELRAYDRCVDALYMVRGLRDMIIAGVFDPSYGNEDAPYAALQVLNAIETPVGDPGSPRRAEGGLTPDAPGQMRGLPSAAASRVSGVRNIAEKHAPPIVKVLLHRALSGHCDSFEPSTSSFSESHPRNNPAPPRKAPLVIRNENAVSSAAPDRKAFERIAAAYLAETDLTSIEIRYDIVGVLVISENRALVRHHVNAITPLGQDLAQRLDGSGPGGPGQPLGARYNKMLAPRGTNQGLINTSDSSPSQTRSADCAQSRSPKVPVHPGDSLC